MGKETTVQEEATQVKTGGKAQAVIGTIINILLVVAIIIAFFCTYTAYVTKKGSGVPNILGYEPFAIQTDSMSPFFEAGDLVIDKAVTDVSELQVGDVITFWTIIEGERVLNTHRIVEIVDADTYIYFVTKGDNNSSEDALTVHQSEVVGKYQTKISGLGTVLDFLQTSKGFFCIIVLPVAAFFIYYLVNFFKVLFEYQAAKNRLQFEEENAAKTMQSEEAKAIDGMTKEQLMQLLAKAQAAEEPEAKAEEKAAETEVKAGEKVAEPEAKAEEAPATAEAAAAKDTDNESTKDADKISLSKEELEALIANAVKKAKEEE